MILLRASKDYPFIYPKIRLSKKDVKIRSCRSSKHFWKKGGDLNKTCSSTRPSCWPRILESFVILLGENRRAIFDDNRCSLLARTREIRIKPGEEIERERERGSERTSDRTLWTRDHANELGLPLSKLQPVRHFGRPSIELGITTARPMPCHLRLLSTPGIHCPFDIMLIAPNRPNFRRRQSTNFCPLNERPLSFPPVFNLQLYAWQS